MADAEENTRPTKRQRLNAEYSTADLDNMCCSICTEPFVDPVSLRGSGHTYCRACITRALANQRRCPLSNAHITIPRRGGVDGVLDPNHQVRSMMDAQRVACAHASHGCTERPKLGDVEAHEASCAFAPKMCARCPFLGSRAETEAHERSCPYVVLGPLLDAQANRIQSLERRVTEQDRTNELLMARLDALERSARAVTPASARRPPREASELVFDATKSGSCVELSRGGTMACCNDRHGCAISSETLRSGTHSWEIRLIRTDGAVGIGVCTERDGFCLDISDRKWYRGVMDSDTWVTSIRNEVADADARWRWCADSGWCGSVLVVTFDCGTGKLSVGRKDGLLLRSVSHVFGELASTPVAPFVFLTSGNTCEIAPRVCSPPRAVPVDPADLLAPVPAQVVAPPMRWQKLRINASGRIATLLEKKQRGWLVVELDENQGVDGAPFEHKSIRSNLVTFLDERDAVDGAVVPARRLRPLALTFDPSRCAEYIELSEGGTLAKGATVNMGGGCAIASSSFDSGVHAWRLHFTETDAFIGVGILCVEGICFALSLARSPAWRRIRLGDDQMHTWFLYGGRGEANVPWIEDFGAGSTLHIIYNCGTGELIVEREGSPGLVRRTFSQLASKRVSPLVFLTEKNTCKISGSGAVVPARPPPIFEHRGLTFDAGRCIGVDLSEGDKYAVGHGDAVASEVFDSGKHLWKLRFPVTDRMVGVGICTEDRDLGVALNPSCDTWLTGEVNGGNWFENNGGNLNRSGRFFEAQIPWRGFTDGSVLDVSFDCDTGTLSVGLAGSDGVVSLVIDELASKRVSPFVFLTHGNCCEFVD